MPFKSEAQRGYFNANRSKLENQGVNVDEWNKSSKGMSLPARAPHPVDHIRKRRVMSGHAMGHGMPAGR